VTPEERQLLETTARSVLKLKEDILDRVSGIEAVLHALFLAKGRTDIALARLRVMADLLDMQGTPSPYLSTFLAREQVVDPGAESDVKAADKPNWPAF
jgi:hypothetical protein